MSKPLQRPRPERSEAIAQPARGGLLPTMRDALFDPESWHESLEAYARTTNLAVALADAAGRLLGTCINPRPTWSRLHAKQAAADGGCPFSLAPRQPCMCVGDALTTRGLVLARDRTGLVHFTVPLVLGDQPLGVLLAGQVFDRYPEQLLLEQVAKHSGLPPSDIWQRARLEPPVKQATLRVYGRLLATLGNAFLRTQYHTIMETNRLAELSRAHDTLEQRVQERTAALHQEMAERQRLEREAQRAEHFALLGRLAAGMSHEIRNPLAAIFLHMDVLVEEFQRPVSDSPVHIAESLQDIRTQLVHMEDLVQDYLSLVRVSTMQREVQDLGTAVEAWVREFQAEATARGRTLHVDGIADLGPVAFHANTLRRALLNLVQNALDAIPHGGTVMIAGQGTATQVQLQVRDTGCGISAERLGQLFEPLYTTKPGGTGLGLYIIREIVTAHGGQVTVASVEGQGTTFTLTLPRAIATTAASEVPREDSPTCKVQH